MTTYAPALYGTMSRPATHYQHVIWVWMENHSYDNYLGMLGRGWHR